jgi:hypothetical protein
LQPYSAQGVIAMSLPADIDSLISELAASLQPPQHAAFEAAARNALAGLDCAGPGLAYRILVPLQRAHWDPPDDARAAAGPRHHKPNRLNTKPAIETESARGVACRVAHWSRG